MTNTFDASLVSTVENSIPIASHSFRHGEQVLYTEGTGPIGGLVSGELYYVVYINHGEISLSNSIRGSAINISSAGAGTATLKKNLNVLIDAVEFNTTNSAVNTTNAMSYTEVNLL